MSYTGLANGHHSFDQVVFSSMTKDNVQALRKLNALLFPIPYTERFYDAIVMPELSRFCKLIYLNNLLVGTICCRLIEEQGETKLYIMTMGVLAASIMHDYRSQKLGSKALQNVVNAARESKEPRISSIFMHVWAMNPDAKRFYERHGFFETSLVVEYYYKAPIECRDAWVLELKLV